MRGFNPTGFEKIDTINGAPVHKQPGNEAQEKIMKAYTVEEIQEAKNLHKEEFDYTGLESTIHVNETNDDGVIDFEIYLADECGNMVTGYTTYYGYQDETDSPKREKRVNPDLLTLECPGAGPMERPLVDYDPFANEPQACSHCGTPEGEICLNNGSKGCIQGIQRERGLFPGKSHSIETTHPKRTLKSWGDQVKTYCDAYLNGGFDH